MKPETPFSQHRLLCVCALAIGLAWPMFFVSAPLVYFDTFAYLGMGEQTVALAKAIFFPSAEWGGDGAGEPQAVRAIRAVSYSVYLYAFSQTFLGLILPVVAQTALTLAMLLPFVKVITWHRQSTFAIAALVAFSTLPWAASYAMPDILAAGVIIWAALLMRLIDDLSRPTVVGLCLAAAFAVSSHYGHIPLAFVLTMGVVIVRFIQKRVTLRLLVIAPIPVLAAMLLNLTASAIALDQTSVAPKRLPILLARSLEDGPAAWYLKDHCDTSNFTMCEIFGDNIPTNITEFLWNPDGIDSLSSDDLDAIRAEEKDFLLAAFKAYPVAQLWSFSGNALLQIVTVGTGELHPVERLGASQTAGKIDGQTHTVLKIFDWITKVASLLAFLMVLSFWKRGKFSASERDLAFLIIAGLVVNAVIFGGLSAPVDRYQSRIVWLLPALWFIHVARVGKAR